MVVAVRDLGDVVAEGTLGTAAAATGDVELAELFLGGGR